MKPPRPATSRQSGRENSVCNKHLSEVFIFLHFSISLERRERHGWRMKGWIFGGGERNSPPPLWDVEKELAHMCICQNTKWGAGKSRWPIYSPHDAADYSSSTFYAGHHACLKGALQTLLRCLRASLPRQHVNLTWTSPITRQKQSISDIGWAWESGRRYQQLPTKDGDFLHRDD